MRTLANVRNNFNAHILEIENDKLYERATPDAWVLHNGIVALGNLICDLIEEEHLGKS